MSAFDDDKEVVMKKVWVRSLGMAVALALVAGAANAGALFSPMDRSREKGLALDESFQALIESPATASLRLVQADAQAVNEKAAALTLNLEPGLELRAHRVDSFLDKSGMLVWSGVIEDLGWANVPFSVKDLRFDPINYVMVVRNGDKLTGNVHFQGSWYKIRPLNGGGHAVVAVDKKSMPADHPEDYDNLPVIPMGNGNGKALEKADTVIRVLVNYTASAAAASGDIAGLIVLAVAESNQGYTNSDVFIDLELAASGPTTYTESGSFSTDLARYRTPGDGFMDEIHATRDASAADVALLVINNASACGLASSIGSTAATAFANAYWDCITGYYSFAHEIGHLQSARHDPKNDPSTSPYAYGHGYQYTKSPSWRTIMAYNCAGFGCPRLNYWSNPNKLYNGKPMGTTTKSDNARVLNTTRATVAAYR
jgi:hypothetical protein